MIHAGILSRPPSYRAAVMRLLDQRGVSYRDVVVTDGCTPTYQRCRTYAGAVRVQAEVELQGQIACRRRWTGCVLTIADSMIDGAPLDDIRDLLWWRWDMVAAQLARWFYEVTAKGNIVLAKDE